MGRQALSQRKKAWASANSREDKIQNVIKAIEKEKLRPRRERISAKTLAEEEGVCLRTVAKRRGGVPSKVDSAADRKLLLNGEEDALALFIKSDARRAEPVGNTELRDRAQAILDARLGPGVRILSPTWVYDFLARRPDLHTYWSARIDDKRSYALNKTNLRDYFNHLKDRMAVCHFEPQNIYGFDESCIMLGRGATRKRVVGARGKNRQLVSSDDSRESFTLAVCISADGSAMRVPPWIIFEGKNFDAEWANSNSLDAQ
jgi:hypothetical protein